MSTGTPPPLLNLDTGISYANCNPTSTKLWEGYNAFYGRFGETALPSEVTRMTWSRFFDAYEPMHALVPEEAGTLVGIIFEGGGAETAFHSSI
jgi:hypothetical protein